MPINIENNLKECDSSSLGKVHFVPCKIEGDGDANVKQYFDPYVKELKDGLLTASFRGHPLSGGTFPLPPGYNLTFITEGKTPLGDDAERNLKVKGQISKDNITYWNWDTAPSQNDLLHKASKWITLAEALHEPTNT